MSDPERRLLDLLEEERAAILTGRYGALAAIGSAKVGAVEAAFAVRRPGSGQSRGLAAMRHNQVLLAAALGGLRGASGLAGPTSAFMAYGKDGRRSAIGPGLSGFERRA